MQMKRSKPMKDTMFKLFEHEAPWRRQYFDNNGSTVTVNTNNTDSAAITVDGITGLNSTIDDSWLGMIIECWDSTLTTYRGAAVITEATSTTTLKVRNLDGSTSIATVDNNDRWYVIGNAHGEGASAPEAWSDELSVVYNSTTEFRVTLEISHKLREAVLRGETDELKRQRRNKMQEYKIQKERYLLYGVSPIGTDLDGSDTFSDSTGNGTAWRTDAEGNKLRTGYGALQAINDYGDSSGVDQSVFTFAKSAFTWADYVDASEKIFQYVPNSGYKKAYCGLGAIGEWNKMSATGVAGNSKWVINLGDMKRDRLGFDYQLLQTPFGVLQMIPTRAMDGPRNDWMFIIDQDNMFMAVYEPDAFHQNIKTDNRPTIQKDEYSGDVGIGITLRKSHHLIKFT
jgi:hypothetical protein